MRFAALRAPWYPGYLTGGMLMMTGDLTEHALTYWVMWQQFHSVPLAGFAVVSHWLPHLLLSIPFGALADRFDCRRIVQVAAALFMSASIGWAVLIGTGVLQPWHCMVLLVVHGLAAALWGPAEQLMLYDMVGPEELPSAVRLMATGLNVGQLVGPAIGAALLFTVGPVLGLALNVLIYVPFVVYLFLTPFTGHVRVAHRERVRMRDIARTLTEVPRFPPILVAMVLQGAVAFFVGSAFVPLLPDFGDLLGLTDSGLGYGLLLVAMATGAVLGGIALEAVGRIRVTSRLSIATGLAFAVAVGVFALSRSYPLSIAALVAAGAANLLSSSTSQALVQLAAPVDRRGRFLGAYVMTSQGFRVGSGLVIGVLGATLGASTAVGIGAAVLVVVTGGLLAAVIVGARRRVPVDPTPAFTEAAGNAAGE